MVRWLRLSSARTFAVVLAGLASPGLAHADPPAAGAIVGVGALPDEARPLLAPLQAHDGLRLVASPPPEVPPRDTLLARARRAYAAMDFRRAISELLTAEAVVIEAEAPTAERVARLADVELFLGACQLLDPKSRRSAEERFALARALAPRGVPDRIFPPEVGAAYDAARPGPPVSLQVAPAPTGARVWIDGALMPPGPARVATGLHYVVVERADRRPAGRLARVSKGADEFELSAPVTATPARALAGLSRPELSDIEGVELSRLLHAPAWSLSVVAGEVVAARYDAADLAQPARRLTVPVGDPGALERAICALDRCDLPRAATRRPVWRRAWFWGVVGASAIAVIGGAIAGAIVATRPRDYDAVVR